MDDALKQSIAEVLNVVPDELTTDKSLDDTDGWDSVAILSLMVVLSEGLGCEIEPEEVVRLKTFGDVEDLIAAKSKGSDQ